MLFPWHFAGRNNRFIRATVHLRRLRGFLEFLEFSLVSHDLLTNPWFSLPCSIFNDAVLRGSYILEQIRFRCKQSCFLFGRDANCFVQRRLTPEGIASFAPRRRKNLSWIELKDSKSASYRRCVKDFDVLRRTIEPADKLRAVRTGTIGDRFSET